ncbi:MAG: hypothetical protein U0575_01525 [Phycisphaerales bacterium]
MATRSGAGTGVIVALVVFVLTTVCLLVLTIVFYSQKSEAIDKERQARNDLDRYVTREQKGREEIKAIEGAASGSRQSVTAYLQNQLGDLSAMVSGNRAATIAQMRADLGLGENDVIRNVLADLRRQAQAKSNEASAANAKLAQQTAEAEKLAAQIAQLEQQQDQLVKGIDSTIGGYAQAVKEAEKGYESNIGTLNETKLNLEGDWRARFTDMQRQADTLRADNALMGDRVRQLQQVVDAIRVKPKNAAELVDGRIVDLGGDDQVFINIGSKDRVVLGMTFEVYDDENSIQVDPRTGQELRGKGSIQVVKVGDNTSTARITRSTTGRPIVKNNVIANAVFDPKHRFKFLVHGKFDISGEGKPTDAGAEFVRSKIVDWGGEVVSGDELTGDLDFLVLGQQPPVPPPLPPNAEVEKYDQYIALRAARDQYDRLFKQAREAQIPVLNWNRFQVLSGMTQR